MLHLEDLARLAEAQADALKASVREFGWDGTHLHFNSQPSLMGVINLSPDSWYRESVTRSVDRAIQRGRVLQKQGAAIIDVGAESTLAHAARAESRDQLGLLLPVIEALHSDRILVSVETYDPVIAERCLAAGARLINLTGPARAADIYRAAAAHGAGVIICYVQGAHVRAVGDLDLPADPFPVLTDFFQREIDRAQELGVERIFIDPGLGFYYRNLQDSSRRVSYQMKTLLQTFRLRRMGWPVCQALPHAFEFFGEEVRTAESFFAVLAILGKTDLLRTHEVPKVKAVLDTLKACTDV